MNIDKEIEDLLYRNDCVIIPGFGAFISTKKSAQLLENQNFIPPRKSISFNSQIVSNDGLLVNYISETRGISYQEALQIVEEVVKVWQDKLRLIKRIYLPKIGNIEINEENLLSFMPEETSNFLTSSFGLTSIISPIVEKSIKIEEKVVEVKEVSKVLPIENSNLNKSNKKYNFRKIAAIFLIFLGISSFLGLFLYNQKIENQTIAIEKSTNEKIDKKISEATFVLPILSFNDYSEKINSNGNYFVVAGSFSKLENAKKLQLELKKEGFQSQVISRSNKMFTVSYHNFSTEIDAENYRKNIQKSKNPEAWVLFEPN